MRKPLALSNWKMAMTIAETEAFFDAFLPLVEDVADEMDIVVCPPYTALYVAARKIQGTPIHLGAQNLHPGPGLAFTGEISASLLADVGCSWVMLGHWERRRYFGETDELVNRKVHAALAAGLRPILLVGEPAEGRDDPRKHLAAQLERVLAGCRAQEVRRMAFVYEPEWAIGGKFPASGEHIQAGCSFIRAWLEERFGAGQEVRIIYGGSVAPEFTAELLAQPDVDGLGSTRKGRDPHSFAAIVRAIAEARL